MTLRILVTALVIVGPLLACAGCAATSLTVRADPPDSIVTIRAQGESPKTGVAAVEANVQFSEKGTETIVVEVEPSKDKAPRLLSHRQELSKASYDALPMVDNDKTRRLLTIKLDQKHFTDLVYVEIVLDPQRRWRGLLTTSRAFTDPAEQGGATPSLIVDFGTNLGITGLALAPDGSRIVYSAASYDRVPVLSDTMNFNEDRLIDLKGCNLKGVSTQGGGGIQQITQEDFRDMFPAFTADGKSLIFSTNRRRPGFADIVMVDASGRGGVKNIFVDPHENLALRPSMSNDSQNMMAFALNRSPKDGGFSEIWTLGGTNGFPTQIAKGSQPQISPDGKRIAFIGQDGNLWVTDVTGQNQTNLTSEAPNILKRYRESLSKDELTMFARNEAAGYQTVMPYSFPSWSSDGQQILFTAMEGNDPTGRPNEDIWIMRADGKGDRRQLTTNGSADRYPLMSRDLKHIYFMSNRAKRWAIWRIPTPSDITTTP